MQDEAMHPLRDRMLRDIQAVSWHLRTGGEGRGHIQLGVAAVRVLASAVSAAARAYSKNE